MPLQMIEPRNKYVMNDTFTHEAVLGHLEMVLKAFASKQVYTKFYIGITGDVDDRFSRHQRRRPDFKLMVPIYEEDHVLVENAFDFLETRAISKFREGIKHPDGRRLLACDNGHDGSKPKMTLYILVG